MNLARFAKNKSKIYCLLLIIVVIFSLFHPTLVIAEEDQGPQAKIVGGTVVPGGAYPWMAVIYSKGLPPSIGGFCGASYIGGEWLVTAAHCVYTDSPGSLEVVIGRNDLNSFGGEVRGISEIIVHPDFDDFFLDSDIALLRMSAPLVSAFPILLPNSLTEAALLPGTSTTVAGWGNISENGPASNLLLETNIPIASNASCANIYEFTSNMLCAGGSPAGIRDSCFGDSGGPLMLLDQGAWYLAGIVSFGLGCAIPNVPGGYTRVSQLTDFILANTGITPPATPVCDSNPVVAHTAPKLAAGDTDLDGVSNTDEAEVGSNPLDPGSFPSSIEGYGAAFWSGFLEMTNVLELGNSGSSSSNVSVILYEIDGTPCNEVTFSLAPGEQKDLILNDFDGFRKNSYGLVTIQSVGGKVDGRVSFYRSASVAGAGLFDFAFSLPLHRAAFGLSTVGFNTFQPSFNPLESTNLVPNWLSIMNLSHSAQSYTIESYDFSGNLIARSSVNIPALGRIDLDGGHGLLGPNNVGKHSIIPSNSSSPYLAFLIRYGENSPAGIPTSAYEFVTILEAKAGNGQEILAPLTTTLGAQNWLEIINTLNSEVNAQVEFWNSSGTLVSSQNLSLAPHSQAHLNINSTLGESALGFAKINSSRSNSIVAQSMVYLRDGTGSLSTAYASQAREALGRFSSGTYNLFLDMNNWLKVINPKSSSQNVSLTLKHQNGTSYSTNFTLEANSTVDFPLHDFLKYGTQRDSVGVVETSSSSNILVENLRLRTDPFSAVLDYIFPTVSR